MKSKMQFAVVLLVVALAAVAFWMQQDSKAETPVNEKCVCAEPSPEPDNATESQQLASRMFHCKCGNLDCAVAMGSFGGMGGRGKNYGLSCVK